MKRKKTLIITLALAAMFAVLYYLASNIAPGSYAHAEIYTHDESYNCTIDKIRKIKSSNKFILPSEINLQDEELKEFKNKYSAYFYVNNIIFHFIIKKNGDKADILFVNVLNPFSNDGWLIINKDKDSRKYKEVFEKQIINAIHKQKCLD